MFYFFLLRYQSRLEIFYKSAHSCTYIFSSSVMEKLFLCSDCIGIKLLFWTRDVAFYLKIRCVTECLSLLLSKSSRSIFYLSLRIKRAGNYNNSLLYSFCFCVLTNDVFKFPSSITKRKNCRFYRFSFVRRKKRRAPPK
jgi:hypothetical protein